jgi:hypothetical protein
MQTHEGYRAGQHHETVLVIGTSVSPSKSLLLHKLLVNTSSLGQRANKFWQRAKKTMLINNVARIGHGHVVVGQKKS